MDSYFERIGKLELIQMFLEAENTINKTGSFSENGILYEHYQKWSEDKSQPMPLMFLMSLQISSKISLSLV